jgi:SAM-dependent methyltransferase
MIDDLNTESPDGWEDYYRQIPDDREAWSDRPDEAIPALIATAGTSPSRIILDLGCGDGRNLWPWLRTKHRVLALDTAPTALARVAARCASRSLEQPVLLQSSMERLPFLFNASVDIVQCLDAMPQVEDVASVLAECARVIRPGGLLLFNLFTTEDCAFGEGEVEGRNAFRYNGTLFRFFDHGEIDPFLSPSLRIVSEDRREWIDPPHIPFRPYSHKHVALYYVCERIPEKES